MRGSTASGTKNRTFKFPGGKIASTGRPAETRVSLLHKPWFDLRVTHCFARDDFAPPPSVDCVLLEFVRRERLAHGIAHDFAVTPPFLRRLRELVCSHQPA